MQSKRIDILCSPNWFTRYKSSGLLTGTYSRSEVREGRMWSVKEDEFTLCLQIEHCGTITFRQSGTLESADDVSIARSLYARYIDS